MIVNSSDDASFPKENLISSISVLFSLGIPSTASKKLICPLPLKLETTMFSAVCPFTERFTCCLILFLISAISSSL
jgi:hypothetical protein